MPYVMTSVRQWWMLIRSIISLVLVVFAVYTQCDVLLSTRKIDIQTVSISSRATTQTCVGTPSSESIRTSVGDLSCTRAKRINPEGYLHVVQTFAQSVHAFKAASYCGATTAVGDVPVDGDAYRMRIAYAQAANILLETGKVPSINYNDVVEPLRSVEAILSSPHCKALTTHCSDLYEQPPTLTHVLADLGSSTNLPASLRSMPLAPITKDCGLTQLNAPINFTSQEITKLYQHCVVMNSFGTAALSAELADLPDVSRPPMHGSCYFCELTDLDLRTTPRVKARVLSGAQFAWTFWGNAVFFVLGAFLLLRWLMITIVIGSARLSETFAKGDLWADVRNLDESLQIAWKHPVRMGSIWFQVVLLVVALVVWRAFTPMMNNHTTRNEHTTQPICTRSNGWKVDESIERQSVSFMLITIVVVYELVMILVDFGMKCYNGEPLVVGNQQDKSYAHTRQRGCSPVVWHYVLCTFGTFVLLTLALIVTMVVHTTWVDEAIETKNADASGWLKLTRTYDVLVYLVWAGVLACMSCGFLFIFATESWLFPKTEVQIKSASRSSSMGKGLKSLVPVLAVVTILAATGFAITGLVKRTDGGANCVTGTFTEMATCNNRSVGLWAGIAIGVIVIVIALGCAFWCIFKPMDTQGSSASHVSLKSSLSIPFSGGDRDQFDTREGYSKSTTLPSLNMRA